MPIKIKIGHQNQANKPIYLTQAGKIICGKFSYSGKYKSSLKEIYRSIKDLAYSKPKGEVLDVTNYKYWTAANIYDDYLVPKWQRTITVEKMEKFASETVIREMIAKIIPIFRKSLRAKWKRIFKKLDPTDEQTPKNPWEIL